LPTWPRAAARRPDGQAGDAPLAAVIDPVHVSRPVPRTPWHQTVICELHLKGFSASTSTSRSRCAARTSASRRSRRSSI
jgi:pullulanase/glycogen debranching enzyme